MRAPWLIQTKKTDFNALAKALSVSPVLVRLMCNRQVTTEEEMAAYLGTDETGFHNPLLMADMEKAVAVLTEKIQSGKKIRIIGDYDIDGVNASYILLSGLRSLGACADADIPDRVADGYGLNENLVKKAIDSGADTLLTCDNGIAAHEAIAFAKAAGLTVLVTDHHQPPYTIENGKKRERLPDADAILNPHREGCAYPYKALCGAGVAYKLILALYVAFGRAPEEADAFLENVAFATVGDIVSLTGENRLFVKTGLARMANTDNKGLRALLEVCHLTDVPLKAWHMGFVLGPCINASGRLDTAKRALALLLAEEEDAARKLAGELKSLNELRKEETEKGVDSAVAAIEEEHLQQDKVLVVYLPEVHESVAGIIAGRIREKYERPAFVLTNTEGAVKGSGRSVEAYAMFDALCQCADLFLKFGGHPMAAGLTLPMENVAAFRERINRNCPLSLEALVPPVLLDMELPFYYATEALTEEISRLEPFGKDNPRPLFAARSVRVAFATVLGKNRNVCRMRLTDAYGGEMTGIYFGDAESFCREAHLAEKGMDMAYYPEVNEYRGKRTMQAVIAHYRAAR